MLTDLCCCCISGEKAGRTLIGKDEPTIWHEALSALPPLKILGGSVAVDDWALERLRSEGEALLENEAKVFEQDLGKRLNLRIAGLPSEEIFQGNKASHALP